MSFALLCLMAIPLGVETEVPVDPNRAYQEERAKAGRSADDQVRLALWCEAHGMARERLNHLTLAVLADPGHVRARALMGTVSYEGRFQRPETIAGKVQADPLLAEYDARRITAPYTADGQWTLGLWAEDHGLADQARAHFTAVVRIDPRRVDVWKRLGYRQHEGRWLTDAQISAEKAEAEAQKQSDRKWKPLLEAIRMRLAAPSKRVEAASELDAIDDPRAIPSIIRVFGRVSAEQLRAVQLLGQIDSSASSRALAVLAVGGRSSEARRAATETLRGRNPIEFANLLIALLGEPLRFEIKHVSGINSPGELLVEGKRVNLRRIYTPPSIVQAGDQLGFDASGLEVIIRLVGSSTVSLRPESSDWMVRPTDEAIASRFNAMTPVELQQLTPAGIRQAQAILLQEAMNRPIMGRTRVAFSLNPWVTIPHDVVVTETWKSNAATEQQLRDDAQILEDHNTGIRNANDRVASTLNASTGQALPADRRAWAGWWIDQVGYTPPSSDWTSRPSYVENIAIDYQPPVIPDGVARQIDGYDRRSCFGAGTPVQTIAGPRAIESLRVGDRVLTQDTSSGSLGYRPILVVHHNPPSATFRIKLKGEPIVASHFHRFWVAGKGWMMARDLKAGDPIRTLEGVTPVESIETDATQPVYNLDVAQDADFFAGPATALVHDNTLPDSRLVPFDAAPKALAARVAR
jgi:Pretoxin HINT domain